MSRHNQLSLVVGLATVVVAVAVWSSLATATPPPGPVVISSACDVLITNAEVPSGGTLQLSQGGLSECDPEFDVVAPGECVLTAGNGLSVEGDNITVDLNGHDIVSTENVAAAGDAAGCDVENAGLSIGGSNNTVINSQGAADDSVVDEFTANLDIRGDGHDILGPGLLFADAHGGGAVAIDRTSNLVMNGIRALDFGADGDNGVDLKRVGTANVTILNSELRGILTGIRITGIDGFLLQNNVISTSPDDVAQGAGGGVEIGRGSRNGTLTGNTIAFNEMNGVTVGGQSQSISITGNTITNNGGCGIEVTGGSTNITTTPNVFASNAGGDVCADAAPPPPPAQEVRLSATLSGQGSGRAQYQNRAGSERLEVEHKGGPPNVNAGVFIDGVQVGTLQLDNRGEGKVQTTNVAQDPVPGSTIQLRNGATTFASGTFN